MASKGRQFKDLMNAPEILIQPGIYDGYTARLVEANGFKAASISGAGVSESRMGWPDRGVMTFDENLNNARRLADCTENLLLRADADTGYGNAMTVHFVVRAFEKAGMAALMFEDQVWPKRCGHMIGKKVVPRELAVAKIKAACAERLNPETWILARTDARAVYDLDEALRRAEAFVKAGADGVFVEAPRSVKELEIVGRSFDVPQICNPLMGGHTPILSMEELGQLGFSAAVLGLDTLMHAAKAIETVLIDMKTGAFKRRNDGMEFEDYKKVVGFDAWEGVDNRFADQAKA